MVVWSAIHVLIVVGGTCHMLLHSATPFSCALIALCGWVCAVFCTWCFCFLMCGPLNLIWLLMRVSWALMRCDGDRGLRIKVAWKGYVACWTKCVDFGCQSTADCIRLFRKALSAGGGCDELEVVDGWRWVGRRCEEIVHLHDTIVI